MTSSMEQKLLLNGCVKHDKPMPSVDDLLLQSRDFRSCTSRTLTGYTLYGEVFEVYT